MKAIYLIRHAKSNWEDLSLTDFNRPLNKKGLEDASFMANKLNELSFNPSLVVCSPAKRTISTSEIITKNISTLYDNSIYEASLNDLIHLINLFPNKQNEIALIGHNPSITLLSDYLTDGFIGNIPTCSIIKIELEIDSWEELTQGIGIQKFFIYPKAFI